ncbi:unnamed protein product [Adineta steineri]|uniref:SKP1 component POZ domain-containing protein n=1 Tax=Adineta steineri TaxID=433720 RepID=A0A814PGV1_9BILA|nr:unnamed protein product [Adineta steineri]
MVGHKVKLQSNDGDTFDVEVDIAKQSVTIKTMLEDLGMEEEEVIPLPNVNSAILKKVIQWATHHKDDPPPPEDDENREKNTNDISTWDLDFLKVDQGTLFELILAANYLDIKDQLNIELDLTSVSNNKISTYRFIAFIYFLIDRLVIIINFDSTFNVTTIYLPVPELISTGLAQLVFFVRQ